MVIHLTYNSYYNVYTWVQDWIYIVIANLKMYHKKQKIIVTLEISLFILYNIIFHRKLVYA